MINNNCFSNIDDMFNAISDIEYVVLRYIEDFINGEYFNKHTDIDLLCAYNSLSDIKKILGLKPRGKKDNGSHYYMYINAKKVEIDIRYPGDGYLDTKWEEDILRKRVHSENKIYTVDNENYFYSYIYHALIQKKAVSENASALLSMLAVKNEIAPSTDYLELLEKYMIEKGYRYTYPKLLHSYYNFRNVDKSLINKDGQKAFRRATARGKTRLKKRIKRILGF